jgi:hypothetical protein
MTLVSRPADENPTALCAAREGGRIDPRLVKGWGVDSDPTNDPTYPMKDRSNGEHAGYRWERPIQQPVNVEVLHSNERPNVSAVFGDATPPTALSGMIRRWAFRYSESSYGHWLPLMFADRINMIEGDLYDLATGQVPNIPAELGWNAEWQHNRKNLIARITVGAVIVAAAVGTLAALRKPRLA